MKNLIILFFILFSGMTFGQEKFLDSLEIKRIDSLTLNIRKEVKNASLKKLKIKSSKIRKIKSNQKILAYLRNDEIVMITSNENGTSISYYFDNGKMIYKGYSISDKSRPSCGFIFVIGSEYYKENNIISSNETQSETYPCPIILHQTIGIEEIYEYVKNNNK